MTLNITVSGSRITAMPECFNNYPKEDVSASSPAQQRIGLNLSTTLTPFIRQTTPQAAYRMPIIRLMQEQSCSDRFRSGAGLWIGFIRAAGIKRLW